MGLPKVIASTLITLSIVVLVSPLASAQTLVINYTDRGWYDQTGYHDRFNLNYVVGITGLKEHRNFFVFDLSSVSRPIQSATLELLVPGPNPPGFESPDPSENYELHDVVTPIATLVAGGFSELSTFDDLGRGVVYGSRTMTAADESNVVEIELNARAIAVLNSSHGLFGIGGSLTTVSVNPRFEECVFGNSNGSSYVSQLRLTLVPEPSTLLLLAISAISCLGYRKAKSHGRDS